ncbi:MAG: flavin reductase family protein [Bacteroidales bacterium]|nr:flavin reductase family protein [Bacteroidales bacterium]
MKKSDLARLGKEDAISIIGKEWMLVTAGTPDKFNTMTASWGGIGFLWGKPVAFVFVRPERYTHQFIEESDHLTLAFLGAENREILNFCGTKSGRDYDKVKETGLVPVATEAGNVTFEQARLTLECRKLYKTKFTADEFIDKAPLERWYNDKPGGGLHDVYIVEIENVYE